MFTFNNSLTKTKSFRLLNLWFVFSSGGANPGLPLLQRDLDLEIPMIILSSDLRHQGSACPVQVSFLRQTVEERCLWKGIHHMLWGYRTLSHRSCLSGGKGYLQLPWRHLSLWWLKLAERKPSPVNVIIPELIILCLRGSKLWAGLLHPLMDIKEYLTWSSPSAYVQGWSVCTLSVDEAEPSRRDCPGGLHHHPNSLLQDRSWCTSFASCLALTRTQHCTAQPHRKITSVLWEVVRKTFLQTMMTIYLLVRHSLTQLHYYFAAS